MTKYPIEVYDTPDMGCYVTDKRVKSLVRRGSKQITFINSRVDQPYIETQDVILNGEIVGVRYLNLWPPTKSGLR